MNLALGWFINVKLSKIYALPSCGYFTLLVLAQCIFGVLTKLLLQEERWMDFYGDLMFFVVLNILLFHRACACIIFSHSLVFTRADHSRESGTGVGWVGTVVCVRALL